ncbi:MAG: glycoside hydrolase family 9 protein [Bacteroidales bacterium]|nr:MAG: glycoside hydrolase family 9 protein [Bacteroidales bacterium]
MSKKQLTVLFFALSLSLFNTCKEEEGWIRINQLGYIPETNKAAVFVSKMPIRVRSFEIHDALTGKTVWKSDEVKDFGAYGSFLATFRLDFSSFNDEGEYYLSARGIRSPQFRIGSHVYDNTADFLLKYMRQQRCGFNPFFNDSCHSNDGFIIFHPDNDIDSMHIDVTGGWHDASDYLQYVATTANAVFQMLFAWMENQSAFLDRFDKDGFPGENGIPDILDEVRWGLDWLVKMNPSYGVMYNQIADDRDHIGFKLPANDTADYDRGPERPVYYCTGDVQGYGSNMNRATGIASTAGKYASAFALGYRILRPYYQDFSEMLLQKAVDAYDFGMRNPGVCQTAPHGAPYFYEEDNWHDDMELAACQLYLITDERKYLDDAVELGRHEPVTPWMGADTAKHYQWYPFLNLGHYFLARIPEDEIRSAFIQNFRQGIERVYHRGINNPFLNGIPFIWCSNNLVAAMLTQCRLYEEITGDKSFSVMEASLRDWLFGCNPWGTSMIVGLPEDGDYPEDTHSAVVHLLNKQPLGGLVDGPVYASIYNNLKGIYLASGDEYSEFQSSLVVYHDDFADYSTNEPTMDGTASLTYYLSSLQEMGRKIRETGY